MEKLIVKPIAPCHRCKERVLGCHDTCKKYLAYKIDQEVYNKAVRLEKEKFYGVVYDEGDYTKDSGSK